MRALSVPARGRGRRRKTSLRQEYKLNSPPTDVAPPLQSPKIGELKKQCFSCGNQCPTRKWFGVQYSRGEVNMIIRNHDDYDNVEKIWSDDALLCLMNIQEEVRPQFSISNTYIMMVYKIIF